MQEGGRWEALVERLQGLWPGARRHQRTRRVRLTWQTCRRCRSKSYLRASDGGLCGGCQSLQ
jgi:hypothetical protein